MISRKLNFPKLFAIVLFPVCLFLTFNKHKKNSYDNYHGVIWSDAAGYYVYLPIWFINKNKGSELPLNIIPKIGYGFSVDKNDHIITKYPCGTAILQTPFFLVAHIMSRLTNQDANGFSPFYHWAIYVAASFYLCLALYFLSSFLSRLWESKVALLSCLIIFLGTNLYYYTIDESGMSHLYSFFLFSCLLFYEEKIFNSNSLKHYVLFGMLSGLIILVRPTNIIFLFVLVLLNIETRNLISRLIFIRRNLWKVIVAVAAASLVFIPQLLYWKKISGSFLYYSYRDESFVNWLSPKMFLVWLSPNNGLLPYTPLMIIILIAIALMVYKKAKNALLLLFLFIAISYLFSSWWSWGFGCSFGARSFVEYLAVFSIPLTWLLNRLKKKYELLFVSLLIIVCIAINLDLTYYYPGCYYGEGNWDFQYYLSQFKD